ncbi:hypothetical protein [Leptolyngbya sp. FACHB-261]|uniref:hypothetical protein n=1 Tax=Leptolyngbya sp. FACHB-261 TaxID=2692806 RepID=UPI00168816E1|nr:hypothetical protein [Leptolyngbya sp. FACHB-261]MBD2101697.1 hypothetical protein [Leptolyngbya sp. FACHB-261]
MKKGQQLGLGRWLSLGLMLLGLWACSGPATEVNLSLQVQSDRQTGQFLVSGRSNLPDQTLAAVQAVRYLQPSDGIGERPYSVLDRQDVRLEQGQWQAQLNLRQARGDDGLAQEAWQEAWYQAEPMAVDSQVYFQLTVLSSNQPPEVARNLGYNFRNIQSQALSFGEDGEAYLQAERSLDVPAVLGSTASALPFSNPTPKVVILPLGRPAAPSLPQSNAPLHQAQTLR